MYLTHSLPSGGRRPARWAAQARAIQRTLPKAVDPDAGDPSAPVSAASLRCDQPTGRPVAPGADCRGLGEPGGRSGFAYLTGLDMTVAARLWREKDDIATVGQRGERIYQGV